MPFNPDQVKATATQLLAGLLANPHLYPQISDDEAHGQQEQILIGLAIDLAENLITKVEERVS
jgi:hypothetical protein